MAYINDSVINCFKKELCELEHSPDKFSRVKATFLKNNVIATLEGCKAADVEEVKHGEWIIDNSQVERTFYEYNYKILITCNICGNRHFLGTQRYRNFTQEDLKEDTYRKYRYCGQCGAKMDGGKE